MTLATRAGVALLLAGLLAGSWLGCAGEAPAPAPEPAAPVTPTPPTPMLPPRPPVPEMPSAQALPVADDFEEEAASEITEDTYLVKLDELEKEIRTDEGAGE